MKNKILVLAFYLVLIATAAAQADYTLKTDRFTVIDSVNVLIDHNYSLEQVLHDSTLRFTKPLRISVKGVDFYWIKYTIQNNSAYDKKYGIWAFPTFDCILYTIDADTKAWRATQGGEMHTNGTTKFKYMPCVFSANVATTFYIKVSVKDINEKSELLKPGFGIARAEEGTGSRSKNFAWWLAMMVTSLAFLAYNMYWYVMIREKVYLYYLLILAGGMVYITCHGFYVSLFVSIQKINALILADGTVEYTPIEFMLMQLSAAVIMLGFVQFTRAYLQTKVHLPSWDYILKIAILIYVLFQALFTGAEYFLLIHQYPFYIHILNIMVLFITSILLIVGVLSYRKKIPQASYFLSALAIPLLLILLLVILLLFSHSDALDYLPNLAILSITVTFAIALVARVNLIKEELSAEKIERQAVAASVTIEKERRLRLEEKIEYDKSEVEAAQHIKLLMKELHHRVKNNLQIVSSLLSLQSFRIKDQAAIDAVKEGQHRIEAMSLIHQRLYVQENITQVNIKEFISDISESLMQAYGFSYANFGLELHIADELVDVDKAIPLSIIINELITNAFKYAYEGIDKPQLIISLTRTAKNSVLSIIDNGNGIDIDTWTTNDGYGKELVQTFTEQLEGTLSLSVSNGTTFKITFPF